MYLAYFLFSLYPGIPAFNNSTHLDELTILVESGETNNYNFFSGIVLKKFGTPLTPKSSDV